MPTQPTNRSPKAPIIPNMTPVAMPKQPPLFAGAGAGAGAGGVVAVDIIGGCDGGPGGIAAVGLISAVHSSPSQKRSWPGLDGSGYQFAEGLVVKVPPCVLVVSAASAISRI